jgi:hypothetical protein
VDGLTTITDYYFPLSGWTPAASTKYVFLLEPYHVFSGSGSLLLWRSNTTSTYSGGVQVLPVNSAPLNEDRYASQITAASGTAQTTDMQFTVYSVNGSPASVEDCTTATGALLQSLDETGSVSVYSSVTYDKVGQTFASAGMLEISGFCFALSKVGAPTGTINLSVKAHTGTFGSTGEPTGAALASSRSYDVSTLTSTSLPTDRFFFPLITPITGPLGTYYTVEFDLTGVTGDGTNYVNVWADSELAGSSSGNLFYDTGAGYTAVSNRDLLMRVYGSGIGDPVVSCTNATGTKLSEFVPAADTSASPVGDGFTSVFTTFNSGSADSISGVCLRLYRKGTPTGTFKVSIRASTTTGAVPDIYKPTGADLAVTSTYDMSTVTGGGESFAADYWFALPFTPSPNTFYTIVAEEQGDFVGDSNNLMAWVTDGEPENATNGGYSTDYGTSWAQYAFADGGHKVYGTSAVEENPLTSIDFGTRTVVTISNTLSADETDALKVDVSQLSPEEGTGRPVREVYIEQIKAITSGVDVDILWDATSPEHCLSISDDSGIDWDFRAVGPLTNNAGAGKTGNILFSTNGASAGSSYSVTLVMRKKY